MKTQVSAIAADGTKTRISFDLLKDNGIVKVLWQLDDLSLSGAASARDFFDCLVEIRKKLEKERIKILCTGARYDVYPSRMSRQMGGGLKAYLLTLGNQTSEADLVNILDPAEVTKVATVEQQKNYYDEWLKSLG